MRCSIIRDAMGSAHIFIGYNRKLVQVAKYLYHDGFGNEADVFLQEGDPVAGLMEYLTPEQRNEFDSGWQFNANIPDEYFPNN